jgi:hypothetical protein
MQVAWFALLLWSICLEGLGRKYLPAVPSVAFYLLKDVLLFVGYIRFPPPPFITGLARRLYGGFRIPLLLAFGWTVVEMFNPDHKSLPLAFLGLRAYWVWWIAPVVVAGVLRDAKTKRKAIMLLAVTAGAIAILAAVQFASPPTSAVNLYTVQNGEEIYADIATVHATGRARVSGTFSFLSGFSAFTILVPALLLSIGMTTDDKKVRTYALVAMSMSAAVLPMSGSRSALFLGVGVLILTAYSAGLFFTRAGRRVMVGVIAGSILAATAFPDALTGLQARFENREETSTRILSTFEFLPPVAMATYEYPIGGLGTGMQQNARFSIGVAADMNIEYENGRYLIELGPFGYLLFWSAKLGLCVALMRCYRILKRANRRAAAGTALSYTFVTVIGNLTFDHVWQSLFFLGCGFILSETASVLRQPQAARTAEAPALPVPRAAIAVPR